MLSEAKILTRFETLRYAQGDNLYHYSPCIITRQSVPGAARENDLLLPLAQDDVSRSPWTAQKAVKVPSCAGTPPLPQSRRTGA